jgi:flagellar biosynthesis/type III secretory pathway chaperone
MASPAQITANRANALLSTGPATPETKSAVRHNAIKYGIHAESLIIPGEDPEEFEAFKEFQLDTWSPQDTAEQQCVDQLTTTLWRLNRLQNAEAQIWEDAMRDGANLGNVLEAKSPLLDRVGRMIHRLETSIRQITKELQRLQAARVKAQRAACIPPRSYPTEQSQFLSDIGRRDADFDDLEE